MGWRDIISDPEAHAAFLRSLESPASRRKIDAIDRAIAEAEGRLPDTGAVERVDSGDYSDGKDQK
jgi:hypothetical protein